MNTTSHLALIMHHESTKLYGSPVIAKPTDAGKSTEVTYIIE